MTDDTASSSAATLSLPSSAVHDIEFDEQGQTWDVYGAEFDPEILGQAIQSHLDHVMKARLHQHQPTIVEYPCPVTSRADDVSPTDQSQATTVRDKRDVIGRFFLRYVMRTRTSAVNS